MQHAQALLEPRKTPVQARSTASVSAILEATIQVLLDVGKERLTTTRVAARAGVSVGTLYQYFPNKSALLQAVLRHHFSELTDAIETVCREQRGASLSQMATALVTAFLDAKMRDVNTSVALYSVGAAKIVRQVGIRTCKALLECWQPHPNRSRAIRDLSLPCSRERWPVSADGCWNPALRNGMWKSSDGSSSSLLART